MLRFANLPHLLVKYHLHHLQKDPCIPHKVHHTLLLLTLSLHPDSTGYWLFLLLLSLLLLKETEQDHSDSFFPFYSSRFLSWSSLVPPAFHGEFSDRQHTLVNKRSEEHT